MTVAKSLKDVTEKAARLIGQAEERLKTKGEEQESLVKNLEAEKRRWKQPTT